jgi:NitT/TauT family transport system substrate-binding protein
MALTTINYGTHLTLSVVAASVGLDPARDIEWLLSPSRPDAAGPRELFEAGDVDAYFALPPNAQELRRHGFGNVILRTSTNRPWSQYFCCMLVSHREHVEGYPTATKRLLRAILKATDLCASEPQLAAQKLAERAPEVGYETALAIMGDVPYDDWCEYDPEDTLRFFALRLRELEFIRSAPRDLIATGTNWRFLNEIKRELKV